MKSVTPGMATFEKDIRGDILRQSNSVITLFKIKSSIKKEVKTK